MRATFDVAPSGPLVPVLEALAEGLVAINSVWVAEQIARGGDPPCCTACAGPPWTAGAGVDYIPFHGDKAKDATRRYIDGPTMFAEGRGTCFDAACYDVACLRVKESVAARVRIVPVDLAGEFHAVVLLPSGEVKDPARELLERGPVNVGAVRRNGVIVRRGIDALEPIIGSVGRGMFVMPFEGRGSVQIKRREAWSVGSTAAAAATGSAYGSSSLRSSCRSCGGG